MPFSNHSESGELLTRIEAGAVPARAAKHKGNNMTTFVQLSTEDKVSVDETSENKIQALEAKIQKLEEENLRLFEVIACECPAGRR